MTENDVRFGQSRRGGFRRYQLSMAYLATGQEDKASDEFNKARKLAPDDAELGAKIDGALKSRPEKAKG